LNTKSTGVRIGKMVLGETENDLLAHSARPVQIAREISWMTQD
jgi:hypothetical protein